MLADHSQGCQAWPREGIEEGHKHRFCFRCAKPWKLGGHGHCVDVGVQQVRLTSKTSPRSLEVGHINCEAYITWLEQHAVEPPAEPPVTVFLDAEETGSDRQKRLGLTLRELLRHSDEDQAR